MTTSFEESIKQHLLCMLMSNNDTKRKYLDFFTVKMHNHHTVYVANRNRKGSKKYVVKIIFHGIDDSFNYRLETSDLNINSDDLNYSHYQQKISDDYEFLKMVGYMTKSLINKNNFHTFLSKATKDLINSSIDNIYSSWDRLLGYQIETYSKEPFPEAGNIFRKPPFLVFKNTIKHSNYKNRVGRDNKCYVDTDTSYTMHYLSDAKSINNLVEIKEYLSSLHTSESYSDSYWGPSGYSTKEEEKELDIYVTKFALEIANNVLNPEFSPVIKFYTVSLYCLFYSMFCDTNKLLTYLKKEKGIWIQYDVLMQLFHLVLRNQDRRTLTQSNSTDTSIIDSSVMYFIKDEVHQMIPEKLLLENIDYLTINNKLVGDDMIYASIMYKHFKHLLQELQVVEKK